MPATPPSPAAATTPPWRSPLFWLLAWALASTASRVLLSQALMWDQAEQTVWSQQLAWGYGPQPPLYTWLQWAVNGVLGPTVLSLALVKKTLMVLTFVFMFIAARQLMPAPAAWLAALGMWWLPGMGWQALRDLTHTVLLTCLVAATWWLLLRQLRRPSPGGFAALGLALGLGVLSKYSYVLFAGAALAAALSLPQPRRALLSRGWWLAPLIAALLVAPHALWVLQHWQEASSSTLAKLRPAYEATGWRGMLAGLGDLLTMLGLAALPWALMAWWAFGRRAWRTPAPSADTPPWAVPLLLRYLGLIVCGLLAMVVLGNVSNFDGRWIHPLVCMAPMAAFAWRPGLGDQPRGRRRYLGAVLGMALLLWLGGAADPLIDARRGRADRFNWPVVRMAERLRAAGYDGRSPIIASHHIIAGVLRTRFPQAPVTVCDADLPQAAGCVRQAVRAAEARGQGWLMVAADDAAPNGWWLAGTPAGGALPCLQTWALPYRRARADTPPLRLDLMLHLAPIYK